MSLDIRSDQLRLGDDVPLHRPLEHRLGRETQVGQHAIERVQLGEITMPADRRTRPAVARALPVIDTLKRSRWQRLYRLRQRRTAGGQVVE